MSLDDTQPLYETAPGAPQSEPEAVFLPESKSPPAGPAAAPAAAAHRPDSEFGDPLTVYTGRLLSRRDLGLFFLPGIAGVLAPLVYGIGRAAYAYTHYGPVAADAWSQPWYALAGLGLTCFILLAALRVHAARPRAAVHAGGLVLRPAIGRERRFAWGALAGIAYDYTVDQFLQFKIRTRTSAWIYPQTGARLKLPAGLNDLPGLVRDIQAQLYPRLQPDMQNRFDAGDWVYFGSLAVCRRGISPDTGAGLIAWSDVKMIEVRAGHLVVELTAGGHRRCPISRIPNLELLFQLIERGVPA